MNQTTLEIADTLALVTKAHEEAKAKADLLWQARKLADATWSEADLKVSRLATTLETLKALSNQPE